MKTVFNVMLLLVVIVSATAFSSCKEKRGELKKIWYNGSYNRDFNDLNDVHLSVAKKIGIEPVSYTHLDVYKRQGIRWQMERWFRSVRSGIIS